MRLITLNTRQRGAEAVTIGLDARATAPAASRRMRSRQLGLLTVAPKGSGWAVALSLAPAIVLFVLVYVAPTITLAVTAFAEWDFLGLEWVGIDNFARLIADGTFWRAVANTAVYGVGLLLIQLPLAVVAGVILSWRLAGWRVFRALLFLPVVISGAAFALTYSMFFDPSYGLLNGALRAVGLETQHNWLFDINTALFSVMATFVFVIGFGMILVIAEIASIPRELYEAAEMDGASRLQRERHVTLPGLRHVIGTAALLGILFALKFFDVVYIMTTGGPADRTTTLGTYGYGRYLADQWGYANAIGVVTLVVGAVVVVAVRRIFRIGEAE